MNQEVKMKPSYLKIAFLDRDGTIIKDYPDEKWREIKEPEFLEGSTEGLKRLKEMGYDFIIITNQYLINDGIISLNDYQQFTGKFLKKLKEENIDILKIYFCPHNEKDHCHCKKPKPGMIEQAKKDFLIDMNSPAKKFNITSLRARVAAALMKLISVMIFLICASHMNNSTIVVIINFVILTFLLNM